MDDVKSFFYKLKSSPTNKQDQFDTFTNYITNQPTTNHKILF